MADDPLTVGRGFVERARQRGRSDDEIARALKAAGWDERALAALWDSLDIPAPPPPPEEPPSDYLAVARSCVADDGWTPAGADPWAQEHAQLRAGGEAALEPIFRVIMDHRQPMADFQSRCDLCGVLADIGGERAARYLQEVCDHRTSVGEYEWVRQSARKALARMAPADSDDPEVLFTRAAEEKDPERKTEMFAALLERFPDLPGPRKHGAHFLTAWAWRDAGDEARARHHFAQALLVVEGDNAYWAEWSSPVWHLLGLRENDWEAVRTMAAEGLAEDEHAPAAPREPEPDPEGAAPPSAPGEAARPALLQRLLGTLEDKEGAALPPLSAAAGSRPWLRRGRASTRSMRRTSRAPRRCIMRRGAGTPRGPGICSCGAPTRMPRWT